MSGIDFKTREEIGLMIEGGSKLSAIREMILSSCQPGVKTIDLDRLAEKEIFKNGGEPSFKTVKDYPYTICASVNEEVVHGLPSKREIQENDVIKIDIGMIYKGFHTDTARTIQIKGQRSKINREVDLFLKAGEKTLDKAIEATGPRGRIGQISQTIQKNIEGAGYSVVRVLTGHGVGKKLHEEPAIPQFLTGRVNQTPEICPGTTLAIEVIYNQGSSEVVLKDDGWTIVTADGKISATFEKTIAVLENGVVVLTP